MKFAGMSYIPYSFLNLIFFLCAFFASGQHLQHLRYQYRFCYLAHMFELSCQEILQELTCFRIMQSLNNEWVQGLICMQSIHKYH